MSYIALHACVHTYAHAKKKRINAEKKISFFNFSFECLRTVPYHR